MMPSTFKPPFPTTTAHAVRLCLFQATRRPRQLRGEAVKTPWGAVRITGRLGQQHADVLEAICYEREKKGELEDGRIKLLVDPARVRRRAGQTSGDGFRQVLDELMSAVIEIIEPEKLACSGHLIDHIDKARRADGSYITRENPLGGERHLWRVEIGKALCTLVAGDIWIGYDPAGIARLDHGISQAVARHVLSHKTQPRGGWTLDTLIRAVAGSEIGDKALRDRRYELRLEAAALRDIGIEIDDGDRVRRVEQMPGGVEQMPGASSKCPALAVT